MQTAFRGTHARTPGFSRSRCVCAVCAAPGGHRALLLGTEQCSWASLCDDAFAQPPADDTWVVRVLCAPNSRHEHTCTRFSVNTATISRERLSGPGLIGSQGCVGSLSVDTAQSVLP